MFPGITCSPPNFLTPSLLPAESLPFFELPPAFFVAIVLLFYLSCFFFHSLFFYSFRSFYFWSCFLFGGLRFWCSFFFWSSFLSWFFEVFFTNCRFNRHHF